jgi:uncharacterized protein DUF6790
MLYLLLLVLSLIVAGIQLFRDTQPRTPNRIAEIVLLWVLVFLVGGSGVLAFIAHTLDADATAASIGWPAGNRFQTEVAVANLAVGVLGILCFWFRDQFWLATVIANAVWLLGDAVVHVHDIVVANNFAPNNAGPALYFDIAVPIITIALLVIARRYPRSVRATLRSQSS